MAVVGTALLTVSLFAIDGTTQFPGLLTLLPVLGTMALIQAGEHTRLGVVRALSSTPMVRIGDWSYSIYLWHWPLIVIATLRWHDVAWVAPTAALVSLIPAIASYKWVEAPLRAYTPANRIRLAGLAVATVSIPLILATGLWQAAVHGFGIQRVQDFQSVVFAQPEVCSVVTGLSQDTVRDCTWNPEGEDRPIYLLGDSNAGQFIDAVADAGAALGGPVVASTTNACPFIDVRLERFDRPDSWNQYCRDYTQDSLEFLAAVEPALVIVSNIDTYWDDPAFAVVSADGQRVTAPSEKLGALRLGLTAMVESLTSSEHEVLIVQTIPQWTEEDSWRTASCTLQRVVEDSCEQMMPRERALARQGEVRDVVDAVARDSDAAVLDPWEILCPGAECSTQGTDFPRYYRDGLHISVDEGRSLAPSFTEAIMNTGYP